MGEMRREKVQVRSKKTLSKTKIMKTQQGKKSVKVIPTCSVNPYRDGGEKYVLLVDFRNFSMLKICILVWVLQGSLKKYTGRGSKAIKGVCREKVSKSDRLKIYFKSRALAKLIANILNDSCGGLDYKIREIRNCKA